MLPRKGIVYSSRSLHLGVIEYKQDFHNQYMHTCLLRATLITFATLPPRACPAETSATSI